MSNFTTGKMSKRITQITFLIVALFATYVAFGGRASSVFSGKTIPYQGDAGVTAAKQFFGTANTPGYMDSLDDVVDDLAPDGSVPWVNIVAHGAVADSASAASTNDTAIASAISSVGASGGIIFFPSGNFTISSVITVTEGNIVLRGPWAGYAQGTGGAYITCNNTDGEACIQIGETGSIVKDSGIESLRVVAGTNTTGIGIRVFHTHNTLLRKVRVQNFTGGHGIRLEGHGSSGVDSVINSSIDKAYITNNLINLYLKTGDSGEATSADEGYFEDIRINMNNLANAIGVRLENAKNNSFSNLQIINPTSVTSGQVGVHFSDSSGSAPDEYAAGGNTIFGLKTEFLTTGIQFDANTVGNMIFGYNGHGNTTLVDDSSGGGNVVVGVTGSLNTNTPDIYYWGQGTDNILLNSDFSLWAAGTNTVPSYWSKPSAGTITQDTSNTLWGGAAVQMVATDTDTSIYFTPSDDSPYEDRYITFGAWVKTSTASAARLRIDSGATTAGKTYSDYHTGGGSYEYLSVRAKPATTGTTMSFAVLGDVAATIYIDAVKATLGYEAPLYTKPADPPVIGAGSFVPQPSAPTELDGVVAYADSANWNPGDDEGLYVYSNDAWKKLHSDKAGYAQLTIYDGAHTVTIGTQDYYTLVTPYDSLLHNTTFATAATTGGTIVINKAGVYDIEVALYCQTSGGAEIYGAVYQNGTAIDDCKSTYAGKGVYGDGTGPTAQVIDCLASLAAADTLDVRLANDTDTQNITTTGQFKVVYVGDAP